jgi:hypothetical protein
MKDNYLLLTALGTILLIVIASRIESKAKRVLIKEQRQWLAALQRKLSWIGLIPMMLILLLPSSSVAILLLGVFYAVASYYLQLKADLPPDFLQAQRKSLALILLAISAFSAAMQIEQREYEAERQAKLSATFRPDCRR